MCQMAADMDLPLLDAPSEPQYSPSHGDEDVESRHDSGCERNDPQSPLPVSKDTGKKKRVNRAAKLKQSKLDARREQWLAQVAGKLNKSESFAANQDDRGASKPKSAAGPSNASTEDSSSVWREGKNESRSKAAGQDLNMVNRAVTPEKAVQVTPNCSHSGTVTSDMHRDLGGQEPPTLVGTKQDSTRPHVQSSQTSEYHKQEVPFGQLSEVEEKANEEVPLERIHMRGFSTWSSSDLSTSRSNSSRSSSSCGGSGSDDEDAHGVDDDWEAAADALHVQASLQQQDTSSKELLRRDSQSKYEVTNGCQSLPKKPTVLSGSNLETCVLKPESIYKSGTFGARMRADAGRAWRPDDVSRPPTLPRLSKQHSFPLQSGSSVWGALHGSIWGPPSAPSHCPICTEELDTTDSSFVPCSCGFRLCLFCHHKIVLGDGRCPGCRKSYNSEAALKLSRTSSSRPRI